MTKRVEIHRGEEKKRRHSTGRRNLASERYKSSYPWRPSDADAAKSNRVNGGMRRQVIAAVPKAVRS